MVTPSLNKVIASGFFLSRKWNLRMGLEFVKLLSTGFTESYNSETKRYLMIIPNNA